MARYLPALWGLQLQLLNGRSFDVVLCSYVPFASTEAQQCHTCLAVSAPSMDEGAAPGKWKGRAGEDHGVGGEEHGGPGLGPGPGGGEEKERRAEAGQGAGPEAGYVPAPGACMGQGSRQRLLASQ